MTQSAARAAPPATAKGAAPASHQPGSRAAPTGGPAGSAVVDTPGLLNRWQLIGMTAVLVFGLLSAFVQFLSWQSDGRAADDTEQLVRVQGIQSTLLHADALATNAFLDGGLEDPDQRDAYDAAIESVFQRIAAAAEAQPADEQALEALNVEVNRYTDAVAEARVNNRQEFPVGAEYLSGASLALRSDALPILGNLADANSERAEGAIGGQHPYWLLLLGIAALVALWWVNSQLSRTFRRRINKGLALAAVIVFVTTLVSAAAAFRGDGQNDGLLDEELRTAVDQAAARTAANDAKANESLRLIKRGSGATYEDPWHASAEIVEDKADPDTLGNWRAYVERHEEIVRLDDQDLWNRARTIATTIADDDEEEAEDNEAAAGSTKPFDAFDDASQALVDEMGAETTDSLRAGRSLALVGSLLTLLLGIVAMVAVARGIGERRREYA